MAHPAVVLLPWTGEGKESGKLEEGSQYDGDQHVSSHGLREAKRGGDKRVSAGSDRCRKKNRSDILAMGESQT